MALFSADAARLIVTWDDGTLEIRDGRTAQHLHEAHAHDGSISALAQNADGHVIVTGGNDRMLRVWDATTLKAIATLPSVNGTVVAAAFSPDGRSLAIAESRQIELWDTRSWQRGEPLGRTQSWFDASFSHNGDRLVSAGDDGTLRVWDARATPVVESQQLADGTAAALAVQRMTGVAPGHPLTATVGARWRAAPPERARRHAADDAARARRRRPDRGDPARRPGCSRLGRWTGRRRGHSLLRPPSARERNVSAIAAP